MIQKWLFVAGSLPLLQLGITHNVFMLLDTRKPRRIVPHDKDLIDKMKASTLRLTPETDMWRAWVGFNYSHGLGIIAISSFYLYMALFQFEALQSLPIIQYAAPVLAACYVILAWQYWFKIPLIGATLSMVLFAAAASLPSGIGL